MSDFSNRRSTQRILLGSGFGISFTLKGRGYQEVPITNLGSGGCFALVGAQEARFFSRGVVLEQLVLMHPDLPKAPILAAVAHVLGEPSPLYPTEMVGIGIQFLSVPGEAQKALDTWVKAAAASQLGE